TLTLTGDAVSANDTAIQVGPDLTGTILTGTQTATLNFQFSSATPGSFHRTVTFTADDGEQVTVLVTARALAPSPLLSVQVGNNNFGGQTLGSTTTNTDFATLTNAGAQPLVISNVQVIDGAADFQVIGFDPSSPVTLNTDDVFALGVAFSPSTTG